MRNLRYISFVGRDCDAHGPSHVIKPIESEKAKPTVYCNTETGSLNWTQQLSPKTEVCKNCLKVIKTSLLNKNNIELRGGFYRYVDRVNRLATTGFKKKNKLIENVDIIRIDEFTLDLMRIRYTYTVDE